MLALKDENDCGKMRFSQLLMMMMMLFVLTIYITIGWCPFHRKKVISEMKVEGKKIVHGTTADHG